MPRSLPGRRSHRTHVPRRKLRLSKTEGAHTPAGRISDGAVRVIGAPVGVALPKLLDVRLRYCSQTEEQPAAVLAQSMLRLGISRVNDWKGSAIDFVAIGLERFCQQNGLSTVSRIFRKSTIRLLDEIVEQTEYERSQSEPSDRLRMFLMVDYEQCWEVSIGPALAFLHAVDECLPAAFFTVFTDNLRRWMRVYDVRDAEFSAEQHLEVLEDEEAEESFYPKVRSVRPKFLKKLPSYRSSVRILKAILPRISDSNAACLVRDCLSMHELGVGYECAWPALLRAKVPEIESYIEFTDEPGPGVLIDFEASDLVEACFTEDVQYLGQDQPIGSSIVMLIDLEQHPRAIDKDVSTAFNYLAVMLRSLSVACEVIERIGDIYDENLRERRVEPKLPA